MGKESNSTSWSRIAGIVSISLAVLFILSTLVALVADFLLVTPFSASDFHNFLETLVLLSSLLVVASVAILVVAIVFCKCSSLISQRYGLRILFASAVTLVFATALNVADACISYSINETPLAGGIVPLSLVSFITDFGWLVFAIYVVAYILFLVSSFLMRDRTGVKEFHVAGVLFVFWLLIELADTSLTILPTISPSISIVLLVYVILPFIGGVSAAGSFAVFGVALRRVAASEARL
jgi:hypothetical protein